MAKAPKNPATNALGPLEDDSHPFQDKSGRFPLDALLRKYGYAIWRREPGKEPIWILHGVEFSQSEVLARLDPNTVEDAKYLDFLNRGTLSP